MKKSGSGVIMNDAKVHIEEPVYERGNLCWNGCNLSELAERHGTPLHVGCSKTVEHSVRSFQYPFEKIGLPFSLYFSVKTNPIPVFLDKLHQLGCGFETVSAHEEALLSKLTVDANQVVQTGINHSASEGVFPSTQKKMITISSLQQLEKLADIPVQQSQRIPIGITIQPGLLRGYWDITLNTSRKNSPIGVPPKSNQFESILSFIKQNPQLDLVGFHMHLGSAIRSATPYKKGIEAMEKAALKAHQKGLTIKYLNIGGGFGLASAPMMKVRNVVSSLLGFTNAEQRNSIHSDQLFAIAQKLHESLDVLQEKGIKIEEIMAEPGRILSGPCQLIVLTVTEVIHHNSRKNYLVCDGGAMSLSPMLLTENHRVLALKKESESVHHYEILGSKPTAMDRISAGAMLPEMKPGDRLAVLDTGAYVMAMSNTFDGPRPPLVWLENGKASLARKPETIEDVYGLDLLPKLLHRENSDHSE